MLLFILWLARLMPKRLEAAKHLAKDELEEMYRKEKSSRVKERIQAILMLYDGKKRMYEVSDIVKRSTRSVEEWIKRWNSDGYDGIVPNFTGGPKPRITDDEWDNVVREIEDKGMTIRDVTAYVKKTRGVDYSYKTVWEVLRKKKHVRYGKPYIRNKRRPDNAEEILKKESIRLYLGMKISSPS